jgi:gamma-glutamyltranspeptidase / glutathione hydrolase
MRGSGSHAGPVHRTMMAEATAKSAEAQQAPPVLAFTSRRSPILCRTAAVASSQPLATAIGYDLLKQGANAAEVAIAVAAALAVTEPCSTGLGGDMFCLYYDATSKRVSCINGSGKSPKALDLPTVLLAIEKNDDDFCTSSLAVTVPGAAAGWEDLLARHGSGSFTLSQLLEPAARLAENGFPVAPVTAYHWQAGLSLINKWGSDNNAAASAALRPTSGTIIPGQLVVNTDLARVLRDFGQHGAKNGFYQGATGQAIVEAIRRYGGCMTLDDLADHTSTFPEPIAVNYRNVKLWQAPPNGQGIAGLIALAGVQALEEESNDVVGRQNIVIDKSDDHAAAAPPAFGSTRWYHLMIEMMRLGFADARAHVTDLDFMPVDSVSKLLDLSRIRQRARTLYNPAKATIAGTPDVSSCTVSFQVVDAHGNAISFVNSNFMGFGTGIVPNGCGFTLQNRGYSFSLEAGHPNVVAPGKRPYHTIIPGLLTYSDDDELYATISNMGGNMQPQGHLQLTLDMITAGLDPQSAIDAPRFCIADGTQNGVVLLEDGVPSLVVEELRQMGHQVKAPVSGHDRSVFGRAQIIKSDRVTGVLWAASDGRADGCAMGF